ncbi:lecithin-cholesterol acyltransferase-like 1 [Aegilops tauschii subsp. strangulata]|uniref:Lecithin-cholesterol acyltransferase-like 1 n=1 Tax=Aegilops tauschii subsp. strangulata TaxID=200361 RepID=A0A453TDU0_AEGTS|nr:lecithin-cholesterol acyltransferase-like 1 [Aegilops tauschii subsp. strangulata]
MPCAHKKRKLHRATAMAFQRLLPLVVLLLLVARPSSAVPSLHPVVLVPGNTCSQLEARLTDEYEPPPASGCGVPRQGRGWFRLWDNFTALQEDPSLFRCYADQLRLVYDPRAGDYRNVPGVKTRVVAFGTTRSFGSDDPSRKNVCMEGLVEALERVGYREGENLFGAPYDFRYAPAAPGLASRAFSGFSSSLRLLVERASQRNGNKPVVLVTHSLGGLFAAVFLDRTPLRWRRRYVKHLVMLCLGVGGSPLNMWPLASKALAANPTSLQAGVLTYGNRSFASMFSLLPSPRVYGRTPLVITRDRNYSADDMAEYLAAAGFSEDEVARYRTRALPVTLNLRAPLVPMTAMNGVGVPTVDKLVFWDANFSGKPKLVNGDGDGQINLETVLALQRLVGGDPDPPYFKSILVPNTTHKGMISDQSALKRVVSEILGASS